MIRSMKKLLVLILIFSINTETNAQKWQPDFLLPLGPEILLNINNQKLSGFLNMNIPWHRPVNCAAELSVFYFRVNSIGKVDSIHVEGNLNKVVSAQIIKNIYKTEGKWRIPNNSKASDNCWFVYPYFLFGNSRPCSESGEVAYRHVYNLYISYDNLADTQDQVGRVIISPNENAKLSEK